MYTQSSAEVSDLEKRTGGESQARAVESLYSSIFKTFICRGVSRRARRAHKPEGSQRFKILSPQPNVPLCSGNSLPVTQDDSPASTPGRDAI